MLSYLNKKCGRTTAFTFLFYVKDFESREAAESTLFTFLNSIKIPSLVSPLHDKDNDGVYLETGELIMKPGHFHVLIDYGSGNNKTVSQMFDLIQPIREYIGIANLDKITEDTPEYKVNAIISVWKNENCVRNMRSLIRYFKHLDNPEKYQYIFEDYHIFGGFNLEDRLISQEDAIQISKDIKNFVKNEECYLFCDLVDYAEVNHPEWYSILINSKYSQFISAYMRSLVYKVSGKLEKALDEN